MSDTATNKEILNEAARLISKPGRWTQGAGARNRNGNPCRTDAPEASCWCAFGAIEKVVRGQSGNNCGELFLYLNIFSRDNGYDNFAVIFNDSQDRQQDEVVEFLRDAAKAL